MKRSRQERRKAEGKDISKPNLVLNILTLHAREHHDMCRRASWPAWP